ncbi:tetratricopeptide repeat protein [Streptacidiphilus sp. N1-12]|uniref:Tetratricopeptide repeat protein n=2 Tax=Streptacidiphilus alkalitolerans TaxID=3342712 RepID=A0ABV6W8E9_9ACTN
MAAAQTAQQNRPLGRSGTPGRLRAQLPEDSPYFTGRLAELAQLRDEVGRPALGSQPEDGADRSSRVLLVAGRPGSGRTALAVRFARSVAEDYPDGCFFVRMSAPDGAPVGAGDAARLLLGALGEPRGALGPDGPADDEADCATLREVLAQRQVLLVLDDVQQADQVRALLPQGPGCLVVAVSSGPLTGLADARPCVIGGLDLAAATAVLVGLAGDTRIVCDPVAARTLAEALACHPTALGLAGGWLRARPRASVTDVLRLLSAPAAAVPVVAPRVELEKQPGAADPGPEPLRRAFELVHAGLPANAARLLRLLTLAPDGVVDPRTASALLGCPVDAAAVHLATLAEQQLLRAATAPGDDPGPHRYRLPGCLRPALLALLAADRASETDLARARLLERLTRLLTACCQLLAPPAGPLRGPAAEPLPGPLRFHGQAEAWTWLDTELPVLRAAVRTAQADGALDGVAMRLSTALVRALPLWAGSAAPVAADLYALHTTVLELALRGGFPRQQAAALVNLGDLHAAAGQHVRALERYRSALGPARAVDDQTAVGRILEAVAGAHRASGDLVRAADWYGRALALRRKRGERQDELRLLGRLAATHTAQGRLGDALRDYRAAAALHRKLGDEVSAVGAVLGAARVQELAGSTEQALRTQREALAAARQCAEPAAALRLQVQVLQRMAEVLERAGDPGGARVQRAQAAALEAGPGAGPGAEPAAGPVEGAVPGPSDEVDTGDEPGMSRS